MGKRRNPIGYGEDEYVLVSRGGAITFRFPKEVDGVGRTSTHKSRKRQP